jgi:hypothetical protein
MQPGPCGKTEARESECAEKFALLHRFLPGDGFRKTVENGTKNIPVLPPPEAKKFPG